MKEPRSLRKYLLMFLLGLSVVTIIVVSIVYYLYGEARRIHWLQQRGVRVQIVNTEPMWLVQKVGFFNCFESPFEVTVPPDKCNPVELEQIGRLTRLINVRLDGCSITPEHLKLLKSLKQLESLSIGPLNITGKFISSLPSQSTLRFLTIKESDISDDAFQSLNEFPHLVNLDLGGSHFSSAALSSLKQSASLEILDLSNTTGVTDDDVETNLKPLGLGVLELSNTDITDASVSALIEMQSLEILSVDGTQITSDGIKRLRKTRPNLQLKYHSRGTKSTVLPAAQI